jgi:hypothetical protein
MSDLVTALAERVLKKVTAAGVNWPPRNSHTCEKGGRDETRTRAMGAALELADAMLEKIGPCRPGKGERT